MKTNIFEKLVNAIWRFLSSVTLTVALLTLLALASIPGTIIEQGYEQDTIEKNLVFMAEIFGPHNAWIILYYFHCNGDRFPKVYDSHENS